MEVSIDDTCRVGDIRIVAVGVGGGGCNTIDHLVKHGVHKSVYLIAANTDAQALNTVEAHHKIVLGEEKTTKGLGAGMDPEVGRKSAEESYEIIKEQLKDAHIVFIAAGLGGGTGTGAAPVVAKIAKELGAITIAVVTKPFKHENKHKEQVAEEGLKNLKAIVDSTVVVPNERVLSIITKNLGMRDTLRLVDNILAQAVNAVTSVVLKKPNGGFNVDYADLKKAMELRGLALIGVGDKSGDESALEALQEALESPLLDNIDIKGAKNAIVHFEVSQDYPFFTLASAFSVMSDKLDPSANPKMVWAFNDELEKDRAKVAIIVTGFEKEIIHTESAQTQPAKQSTPTVTLKKVSGGRESIFDERIDLDIPSFLRSQMD